MLKRIAQLSVMGVLACGFLGLAAETASAHSLTITASAACGTRNNAVITFTATSWLTDGSAAANNSEIDISFNGTKVDQGAFTAGNGDTFTDSDPAPNGNTSVTVTGVAIANWGDGFLASSTAPASTVVSIPSSCATGRFTGGGKEIDLANGVAVTQGFEVDCDLNPPNNLEVNWAGNHFHMDLLTNAVCTLVNNPAPPKAPINTFVGIGTGKYNGADGYTVHFTLIDNGEPGVADQIAITIFPTGDSADPVLSFGLTTIIGGNLQAHPDQH